MKNRNSILATVLGANLALAACTGGGAARVEPANIMAYEAARGCEMERPEAPGLMRSADAAARPGAISLDCFRFPQTPTPVAGATTPPLAYELALESDLDRNRLAYVLISQADTICTIEKSLMLERQAEVNGWLSIATTGLSVASTIVTGQNASDILSGAAAFTSGSRDHVNTHVYRNQIIQTITTAIDNKRAEALTPILANLKKAKDEYPIDAAIRDVNAYHQLCSFGMGLQTVMEAVEKQATYEDAIKLQNIEAELIRLDRDARTAGAGTAERTAILEQIQRLRSERILRTTEIDLNPPTPEDETAQELDGAGGA